MNVTMSWSNLSINSKKYVNDVLDSGWLSRHKYIPEFEAAVAKKHGAKYGVLVNSGTDALRIAWATLKEINQWPDGSEVVVPALTFVATANAVLQNGLRPVFADVDISSGNINPDRIAERCKSTTIAVNVVHLFGRPVSMPAITTLCKRLKLSCIEDSCETFGVHRVAGDMACFSFYVSHHVSTGVGGMILTNNPKYERVARSYMNHGRVDDGSHFEFGRSGYSSRITEMEAALGMAALEHFDKDLSRRKYLADVYYEGLFEQEGVGLPTLAEDHSWMFFPVFLHKGSRDKMLKHLRKHGIESREAMPIINQPVFKDLYVKGSCPNAEAWTDKGLLLPLHPQMTAKDVDYVCGKVHDYYV